jgi:hypothetical protein
MLCDQINRRIFLVSLGRYAASRPLDELVHMRLSQKSSTATLGVVMRSKQVEFSFDVNELNFVCNEIIHALRTPGKSLAEIRIRTARLDNLVWQRIEKHLPRRARIIIDADDGFPNIPLECCHCSDGSLVGANYEISRASVNRRPNPIGFRPSRRAFFYSPLAGFDLREAKRERSLLSETKKRFDWKVRSGAAASFDRLRADLSQNFAVLHIVSHSQVNRLQGDAEITLGSPEGNGQIKISAGQIRHLRSPGQLVVLSSCDSGTRGSGNESPSLAQAFLMTGVQDVVGSMWSVDDFGSLEFMKSFYKHLQDGLSIPSAVRAARRDFLSSAYIPLRNHPHYWSAFAHFQQRTSMSLE